MIRTILLSLMLSMAFLSKALTLGFPGEESALVGIYVKDIRTGKVLAQQNASKGLVPASITKSFTAATALNILGEDFRFNTNVYLTGNESADTPGQWCGNLVIESCGDPTIDSELFRDRPLFINEIVDALKEKGINAITGNIVVDESLSDEGCIPQWEIDDVAWGYGAGLYGLNFRDNTFRLWPATGKTEPRVPNLNVTVKKGTDGTDLIRGVFSNSIEVFGSEPGNEKWSVTTTMNDPADVFATALYDNLNENGIEVYNMEAVSLGGIKLMTHSSALLRDILCKMMYESHNLYAEGMLRAIAPGETRKQAIDKELKHWKGRGINTAYNKICDGSGLARADRIQPLFLASVLESMASNDTYVSLFPKVGKSGTVANFMKKTSLEGKLALKTGSMNAVQCYAGYKLDNNGKPTHVVVIMINSFYCQRSELRGTIEKFLLNTFK